MNWKTLESTYINQHIYFTARRDRCEQPDGTIVDPYFVVELPPSATALAITQEGAVVMVQQYRHPIGETLLETPGGFIDEQEDFSTGMQRELLEETGYEFTDIEYLGKIAANPGVLNNFTHLFLATGGRKVSEQKLDHNEDIQLVLMSLSEIQLALEQFQIKQSLHANCLFYGLRALEKRQQRSSAGQ
jgi:8-oxo-dGTP pyrophosphatase MutT (NUDIX family)